MWRSWKNIQQYPIDDVHLLDERQARQHLDFITGSCAESGDGKSHALTYTSMWTPAPVGIIGSGKATC